MSNPLIRKIAGRGDRVLRPSTSGKILPRKTISQRPHRAKIFTAFLFPRCPLPLLSAFSLRVRPFDGHVPPLFRPPGRRPSAFTFFAAALCAALCAASARVRAAACLSSPLLPRPSWPILRARLRRFHGQARPFPRPARGKTPYRGTKKAALSPVQQG